MNLGELRNRVYLRLSEVSGATFSDSEINGAINDEYLNVLNLVNTKNDEYLFKTLLTNTTTNELYAFPSDLIKVLMLEILMSGAWYELIKVSIHQKEKYKKSQLYYRATPHVYYYLAGSNYGIVPVRTVAGTNDLRLSYVYQPPLLGTVAGDLDIPVFPQLYHEILTIGATNRLRKALKESPIDEPEFQVRVNSMLETLTPRVKHRPTQVRTVPGVY